MSSRRAALWALLAGVVSASPVHGAIVPVTTVGDLVDAIAQAAPGDVISLAPGTYDVGQNLLCDVGGTAAQPITVRAENLGDALIRFDAVEGFKVSEPYWIFENLDIEGVCSTHSQCEHAFHLFGNADFTVIRGSRLHEYNAMIKSNGFDVGATREFPDDVVIEFNEFWNSTVRATANPVTFIDVVGGRRWVVRANLIADHAKGSGNQISYAAFLKGNSKDGLFERNLVICERDHTAGIRLGLSFGGGGSGPPSICEEGTCTPEHDGGVMRNNVIVNCPDDVGIYLNEAANVGIYNNTIYDTTGIDVRFAASVADLRNNILSGRIRERDGGTATKSSNLEEVTKAQFDAWFTDPAGADFGLEDGTWLVDLAEALAEVTDDACANDRNDGFPDRGAVEYDGDGPCDTTLAGGVGTAGDDVTLAVTKAGAGAGTVTSLPGGIDCGADCDEGYTVGSRVRLLSTPAYGSELTGWSGDADCTDGDVTLAADTTCTATYEPCSLPSVVTVANLMIGGSETHAACNELRAGPAVVVTGSATLLAGNLARLDDGFEVREGGELAVRIGEPTP